MTDTFKYLGKVKKIVPNKWKGKTLGVIVIIERTESSGYIAFEYDDYDITNHVKPGDHVKVEFSIWGFSYPDKLRGDTIYKNNVKAKSIIKL